MLAQHLGALGGDGGDDGGNRSGGAPSTSAANAAAAASGGPREMASLVDSLMQQLLSKEVLYQPMKVGRGAGAGLEWQTTSQEAGLHQGHDRLGCFRRSLQEAGLHQGREEAGLRQGG